MVNKIQKWLADPKRKYAEGLAFFMDLGSENLKKSYAEFLRLKVGEEDVKPFDSRFPVLINKLNAILNKIKQNPEKYVQVAVAPVVTDSVRSIIRNKALEIKSLAEEKQKLQTEVSALRELEETKDEEISDLESEIEEKDELIETLGKELEEKLSLSGLKVVLYADMPDGIRGKYDRTREITPLMAKIHAELSACDTDEERKLKAGELCALDDERRSLWDAIDDWSLGKNAVVDDLEVSKAYSEDPLVKGMQISNRISRLTENIARTRAAIDKHTQSGKANLVAKAQTRLAEYEQELTELNALVTIE